MKTIYKTDLGYINEKELLRQFILSTGQEPEYLIWKSSIVKGELEYMN